MSEFNPVGRRADKYTVTGVKSTDEIEDAEYDIVRSGVVKKVEHYTITCDECGGIGRYDERREVVCQSCGMVLSGDRQMVMFNEHANENTEARGDTGVRGATTPIV